MIMKLYYTNILYCLFCWSTVYSDRREEREAEGGGEEGVTSTLLLVLLAHPWLIRH